MFFQRKDVKEQKIEELLLENYNRYYRLAYSYVHNEADAADIVQNGAYKAIRNSDSLKNVEYAQTWIYRIMLNEIFQCAKKKQYNNDGLCIWMDRMSVQLIALAQLNKRAKIHNTDSVGNMTDNGKIMGNEQISQTHLLLHVFQHVYHL